jgi:hypothetical protein
VEGTPRVPPWQVGQEGVPSVREQARHRAVAYGRDEDQKALPDFAEQAGCSSEGCNRDQVSPG